MKKLILSLLIFAIPSFANIAASTVWEVRTTGNDTNGGGYSTGGTDLSQFDNKNAAGCTSCQSATVNISTGDGVANGTTTFTSATGNYSSALIGNTVWISGGGGSIVANWYQVASVTNSTTIVLDRSTGLTSGTAVSINIGGALLTWGQANTNATAATTAAGNAIWVKVGTGYSTSATITFGNGTNGNPITWKGYTSSRGDNGKPTMQSLNNAANPVISLGSYNTFQNFILDGNTHSGRVLNAGNDGTRVENVHIIGSTGADIALIVQGRTSLENVYVNNNTGLTNAAVYLGSGGIHRMVTAIGNGGSSGISQIRVTSSGVGCERCIAASPTTGTVDGFACDAGVICSIRNSVAYANTRNGIQITSTSTGSKIQNNVICSNTTNGISSSAATGDAGVDYNFFYGNGTNYNNVTVGPHDVTSLTGVPFTNAGSGDYSLNSTANQGALVRQAGFPGVFTGISTTSFIDGGPAQSQVTGGGGGGTRSYISVQ